MTKVLKKKKLKKTRKSSGMNMLAVKAGDDCGLGAGQVLAKQPRAQVSVRWAAGSGEQQGVRSSCWPQDLYKVGKYESDDGELWDDEEGSGNNSWETQSEEKDLHTDTENQNIID